MTFLEPRALNEPIAYITCLHDLGRGNADGRGIDEYLRWLIKTANLLPNLMVFTDIQDVRDLMPPHVRVIDFNFSQFDLYGSRHDISAICAEQILRNRSNDVTVTVPDYAILQFGKFQLLDIATSLTEAPLMAWVDAGICRFANSDSRVQAGRERLIADIMDDSESLLEVDFRRNVSFGRIRYVEAGTFRKTFSGGMLVINRLSTARYRNSMIKRALSWLENKVWDNEQIGLNQLFHAGELSPLILRQEGEPGTLIRFLQGLNSLQVIRPVQKKYERLRAKSWR